MRLSQQLAASNYLSELLDGLPEFVPYVRGEQGVDEGLLKAQIAALGKHDSSVQDQTEQRSEGLRMAKQRFALLWSIAALEGRLSFSTLGQLQSAFAQQSIQVALEIAWHSPKMGKLFVNTQSVQSDASGIFILALGKLGGYDLNFSSDIDLIAFYDKQILQVAPMHGASYAVTECLKLLTSILSETTDTGFVWRVDWRLRPYASLRNLSMVSDKALDFYHYHARPWHRLAMLKARPVAGNLLLGEAFLSELRTFLWRYNLDYRAIDDIALLKTKINLEHPALQAQRAQADELLEEGAGFNLKLGHGGIREIEFIVNALQLLWGGRKPALRLSNTLQALDVLRAEGLLENQAADDLKFAYVFLRQAENYLQMLDNAQRYHLPEEALAKAQFLKLAGLDDWDSFEQSLSAHRIRVHSLFKEVFHEVNVNRPEKADLAWQDVQQSEQTQKIIQHWEDGFQVYGGMPGQAHYFEPLLIALSQEIKQSGCELDAALEQIDAYFRLLPPGGQYFRLLRDFPWLLGKLIAPLLLSPSMSDLLHQSPHIVDRFLEQHALDADTLDTTIVFTHSDYEYRLENLRRLANEELYLRYGQYFEALSTPDILQAQLTRLAEQLLEAAVQIACDEMQLVEAPIAVIGFGKLGSSGMMPKSDLDLVYLCESMQQHALASKFASRLNTIINAPMREGRVYELDTRLRPSGNSGSVTISLQSYQQHQLQRAHNWSHLALVPTRFVAGNTKIGQQFSNIKQQILSRPRDVQQFKLDCAKMLKRVQDQRIRSVTSDQFTVKLRPGGLFELEYLINCLAVLYCVEHPEAAMQDYDQLVRRIDSQYGNEILPALKCLRTLQLEIRLFGRDDLKVSELPAPVLAHVLSTMACDNLVSLTEKIDKSTKLTTSLLSAFFKTVNWDRLSAWKEAPVTWHN